VDWSYDPVAETTSLLQARSPRAILCILSRRSICPLRTSPGTEDGYSPRGCIVSVPAERLDVVDRGVCVRLKSPLLKRDRESPLPRGRANSNQKIVAGSLPREPAIDFTLW
jgi:hypothetical protein